jgi:hypothetical protein
MLGHIIYTMLELVIIIIVVIAIIATGFLLSRGRGELMAASAPALNSQYQSPSAASVAPSTQFGTSSTVPTYNTPGGSMGASAPLPGGLLPSSWDMTRRPSAVTAFSPRAQKLTRARNVTFAPVAQVRNYTASGFVDNNLNI